MTVELTRVQLQAFLAIVSAILIVSLAPVLVTGIVGKSVPDSLIAVSDKTVTGLIGVLGTLVGVMWQRQQGGPTPAGTKKDPIATEDVSSPAPPAPPLDLAGSQIQ